MPWRLILDRTPASAGATPTEPVDLAGDAAHRAVAFAAGRARTTGNHRAAAPRPAAQLRAVWALTGEGSPKPMQGEVHHFGRPARHAEHHSLPERWTDFDRFQITHLSSNFSDSNYTPNAAGANLMLVSALGGWLDSRGAWDPPGLSVEEWVHRATMGARPLRARGLPGISLPLRAPRGSGQGERAQIPQRPLGHDQRIDGNPAYLRQRMFIVVASASARFADPALLTNTAGTVYPAPVSLLQRAPRDRSDAQSRPARQCGERHRRAMDQTPVLAVRRRRRPSPSGASPPTSTAGAPFRAAHDLHG